MRIFFDGRRNIRRCWRKLSGNVRSRGCGFTADGRPALRRKDAIPFIEARLTGLQTLSVIHNRRQDSLAISRHRQIIFPLIHAIQTLAFPGGGKSLSMVKLNPKLQVNSLRADSTQRVNGEGLGGVVGIEGSSYPGGFIARSRDPLDIL